MCSIWVGSSLACKYYTKLESIAKGKHSSLLETFANYGRKKSYCTGRQWKACVSTREC